MVHLITGGSGSGKSVYAEAEAVRAGTRAHKGWPLIYVAAMIPYGKEAQARIQRHREQRMDAGFITVEKYRDVEELKFPDNGGILLECVSNLTANELYREDMADGEADRDAPEDAYERTYKAVISGIRHLSGQTENLVIVTNEVCSDINGYSEETEKYRELLGRINCELARMSDKVTEVACGIPIVIKNTDKEMEKDEETLE